MCIGVWLWNAHPRYRLLLALNRDEDHDRPTKPVHWWEGGRILAGKDCIGGGTWFAASRNGRVAFVTNFREPASQPSAKTRGELVTNFLQSSKSPIEYGRQVYPYADAFNGFNLMLIDLCTAESAYITNRHKGNQAFVGNVSPGLHVLSNAQLDTPWPKAEFLRKKLKLMVEEHAGEEIPETEVIDKAMKDKTKANRSVVPRTGWTFEWDYALSSVYVDTQNSKGGRYGTRSIIVISVDQSNNVNLYEQYLEDGIWKDHRISFEIECHKENSNLTF